MQVPGEVLRGGSTSGAPSALPLFLSPRGGWGYPVSLRGGSTSGAPPSALPLFLSEGWVGVPSFPARGQHLRCSPSALPPWVGLPGPHPGFLSFHDERNQRRAGATAPGPREGGTLSPLRRRRKASRTPPMGVSDTTKDRFAHPLQAGKPVFCSPAVSSREHVLLSICGAGNLRCKMSKSLDILHLSVLY